jgi:outer membrane protein assembly factor BamA
MKTKLTLLIALMTIMGFSTVQSQTAEKTKKGFSFGAVPAIAYDSDLGFRYGALANFYDYGDGTIYPFYKHSLYVEWSHTTKGSDLKQIRYDSEYLIPGIRFMAEARYETEQAMDFYGFNGFETMYNPALAVNTDSTNRFYYRMDRTLLRLKATFQGKIIGRKLRWYAGAMHYNLGLGSVDIAKLNKGKSDDNLIPEAPGLYDKFKELNVIPADQANGGGTTFLAAGIIADTRDNEPNPNKGLWSEAMILSAPGFLWNKNPYTTLVLSHRQYFTLLPERLTFAYRLNYQTTIAGQMPWYMLNFTYSTFDNREGLGGSKTLRGVLRNRIVGEGYMMGNFEFRWKFAKFQFIKQNWYLALSPFMDVARITKPYNVEIPAGFYGQADGFHVSYGAGLHIALNQNFIVAVDYGFAANKADRKNDGKTGMYIGLDFLF